MLSTTVNTRPKNTTVALYLFWTALIIEQINSVTTDMRLLNLPSTRIVLAAFLPNVLVSVFIVFIYYKISRGRNWARIWFVVIFAIDLLFTLDHVFGSYKNPLLLNFVSLSQLIEIVTTCIYGYGLYLLYTPVSNQWFRKCTIESLTTS